MNYLFTSQNFLSLISAEGKTVSCGFMSNSRKSLILQTANILAFAITLAMNGLANTTLLGGKFTGQISDENQTLITPAGYVFSIWGIIYALLLVFVIYQAFARQRTFQKDITFLFALSCALNVLWLFLWQYSYITISVLPMIALLATLVAIYLRLKIGKFNASLKEKACVHLPFSVYLAWITVATAANIAAAMYSAGWVKWESTDAAVGIVILAALLLITLAVIVTRRDIAYSMVIIWALIGIAVKQASTPNIVYTAGIGAAIIALALSGVVLRSRLKKDAQKESKLVPAQ
jgi:benzodiazapine receptor